MQVDPQPNRFNKGDTVRVNDGRFKGFVGVVAIVNAPKWKEPPNG